MTSGQQGKPAGIWRPLLLTAWIALIFGTSCTVIRPQEFFSLVARWTGANTESMRQFAVFWGVSWFVVVKGWHFTEFVILTFFSVAVARWWTGRTTPRTILCAMLFCIAFAASDEWHQTFVPDRFGTVQDVLIDSLGVCTAGMVCLIRTRSLTGAGLRRLTAVRNVSED